MTQALEIFDGFDAIAHDPTSSPIRGTGLRFKEGLYYAYGELIDLRGRAFAVLDRAQGWQKLEHGCSPEYLVWKLNEPRLPQPHVAKEDWPPGFRGAKPEHPWKLTLDLYLFDINNFVSALAKYCKLQAQRFGYLELYDGARRHWTQWVAWADWTKGAGPCSREEAERRIKEPAHPWYRKGPLRRVDTFKAMNALIQGSAARHTKLWMRDVWRAGIVPHLQMHDSLDCSVSSPEQAELVARLGREAVKLEVPIEVDLKYGRNRGDATHSWDELQHHNGTVKAFAPSIAPVESNDAEPAVAADDDPGDNETCEVFAWPELVDSTAESPAPPYVPALETAASELASGDTDDRPEWLVPILMEVSPGGAAFEAILAGLSIEDRVIVRPPKPNSGAAFALPSLADLIGRPLQNGKIHCPFHADRTPSLQVYPDHYHCYGCGAHGDHLDWLTLAEGKTREEAIRTCENWNGPRAPPIGQGEDAEKNSQNFERATRIWEETRPIAGTLAERYLTETRRLDLAVVPDVDAVLRFHSSCPFNGTRHPCVVALFRDVETNEAAGIHRIALTAEAAKIDRMMLGSWSRPRAIKLRAGGEQLLVGEGIETAIAGDMKVCWASALWALGSAGAIERFPVITSVAKLGILVDRDGNGIGVSSARLCADR
jgi:hypothetical protein